MAGLSIANIAGLNPPTKTPPAIESSTRMGLRFARLGLRLPVRAREAKGLAPFGFQGKGIDFALDVAFGLGYWGAKKAFALLARRGTRMSSA